MSDHLSLNDLKHQFYQGKRKQVSHGDGTVSEQIVVTNVDGGAVGEKWDTHDVDASVADITYVLKVNDKGAWRVVRIVDFGTNQTTLRFAGNKNNSSISTAGGAWVARASLVYGYKDEA